MEFGEPEEHCHMEAVLSAITGRWKLLIIYWLIQGPCRFNQLQRHLGSITHRTLTRQLNELQAVGFVSRKDFRTIPPHVEYSLTTLGHSLMPLLEAMRDWSDAHGHKVMRPEAND